MTDQHTKTSRGFGFVTFRDPETVQKVCAEKVHILDNKKIDPKPAVPRGSGQAVQQSMQCTHVQLISDKQTGKPRGFGFVTFQTKEDVGKAVQEHFHQINGKTVEVKKAEHKANAYKAGGQNNLLATPPVHSMQNNMGRGQYGQQVYMSGYGQQPGGMQGMGRGGYNAYGGYGAVGGAAGFNYGAPQAQGYGAGMSMGGAAPGAGGYPQAAYPSNPQMSSYGTGAGREPAAPGYGAPGYGNNYPAPGAMPPGAPTAGAQDYGQGMPPSSLSGPGSGMPSHGDGGVDYTPSYSAYGLGSYQQQDSQYGPARGSFGAEAGYSPYPSGESYGNAGGGGGAYGAAGGGAESFGRGSGGAARGFHPYGR
ncbi:RNA-binding protein Musashi-like 1 [Exaiptasia diaphana]|nr:RNA-binding protein Musashi-like 1 [Exaiptasia diaphana]